MFSKEDTNRIRYYQLAGCWEDEMETQAPDFRFGARSIFRQLTQGKAARYAVDRNVFHGASYSDYDLRRQFIRNLRNSILYVRREP
jgi:hypothetical protein